MRSAIIRGPVIGLLFLLGGVTWLNAQENVAKPRCGTMEVLKTNLERDPVLRTRFNQQKLQLRQMVQQRQLARITADTIYVPIVFHIVLQNPNLVTDEQLRDQIDTLNKDFAGLNGDSVKILPQFKHLFGKSIIQFRLARRTPNDQPSTGIVRKVTTRQEFNLNDPAVKYSSMGGDNAWDRNRFFNVWITDIVAGYLGYATFPQGSSAAEDGVVLDYTCLPGGVPPYDRGRTLTHETGHYFSLFHIWGEDNSCNGGDDIDDTPNQGAASGGCPTGIQTDDCSPTAPGIMYQNFMDYTNDPCMVMFTLQQVARMEESLTLYRNSYRTTNGHIPVGLVPLDASLRTIHTPVQRACAASFTPSVTLRNSGIQTLTAVDIHARIDDGTPVVTHWTGSLQTFGEALVNLEVLTTTPGHHTLTVYITNPNGGNDLDKTNDTLTTTFLYQPPVSPPLTEGFEGNTFPPAGWDVLNPDQSYTWERVSGVGNSGQAAVVMRNFNYTVNDMQDLFRLPVMKIANADSAFMTFQVAAAISSNPNGLLNPFDTLEVLASTDCGLTYTSLYKKWGAGLITRNTPVTTAFTPNANEWRKDSVNLTPYIGQGEILLAFRNTTQNENNIYLDDINVYSVVINPNLKTRGVLISPNPVQGDGQVNVQFYPNPVNLRSIAIYSITGAKVAERLIGGAGSTLYRFDMSLLASGVYVVHVVFSDRTVTQKIIKR
jgi:Pregnancy-associated plasma protein-A.